MPPVQIMNRRWSVNQSDSIGHESPPHCSAAGRMPTALREQMRALASYRSRFVWRLLAVALAWYFGALFAVLAWPDLMATSALGDFSVGLLLVCLQLLSTVVGFWVYCAWAERRYDGEAATLHAMARHYHTGARHE